MELLEKIKTEYMLYEPAVFCSVVGVEDLLECYRLNMSDSIETAKKAIKENNFDSKIESFKRSIYEFFGIETTSDLFEEDTEILKRHCVLAETFNKYFIKMSDIIDENNFSSVSTLAQFTFEKYLSNYSYLESLRDSLRFSVEGINYFGQGIDDSSEFKSFFEEEINNVIAGKKEKVKKD